MKHRGIMATVAGRGARRLRSVIPGSAQLLRAARGHSLLSWESRPGGKLGYLDESSANQTLVQPP